MQGLEKEKWERAAGCCVVLCYYFHLLGKRRDEWRNKWMMVGWWGGGNSLVWMELDGELGDGGGMRATWCRGCCQAQDSGVFVFSIITCWNLFFSFLLSDQHSTFYFLDSYRSIGSYFDLPEFWNIKMISMQNTKYFLQNIVFNLMGIKTNFNAFI